MEHDVVIVGGGAAGLMSACVAAGRGLRVLLIEKMDQCGRKLRITGKGRCNLTNTASLRDTLPRIGSSTATSKPGKGQGNGGVWLRNAYGRFFNRELMDYFERRGVPLTEERGGRVFPASGKALDVFLALIGELEANPKVTIRKNCTVKKVETYEGHVTGVVLQDGSRIGCRRVVLATGGMSYPTTGSTGAGLRMAAELGHTVVEAVPALVPLRCQEPLPSEVEGFVLKNVGLSLLFDDGSRSDYFGEMAFCRDGLAGPIAISASRAASRRLHSGQTVRALIDLKPALDAEQLDRRQRLDIDQNGKRLFNDALRMWLPAEIVGLALKRLHIEYYKRLHQLNGDERRRLGKWLKGVEFTLCGTHDFNEAIVTQGGVSLTEVNPKTMESLLVGGLYVVGELLDLDADTGGFNLQIAFSTAHAAAMAL